MRAVGFEEPGVDPQEAFWQTLGGGEAPVAGTGAERGTDTGGGTGGGTASNRTRRAHGNGIRDPRPVLLPPRPRWPRTRSQRFLRYVRVDTQSREGSETYPSTAKQLDLSRLLVEELQDLGLADAALDEHGYVMATLPATATAAPAARCR